MSVPAHRISVLPLAVALLTACTAGPDSQQLANSAQLALSENRLADADRYGRQALAAADHGSAADRVHAGSILARTLYIEGKAAAAQEAANRALAQAGADTAVPVTDTISLWLTLSDIARSRGDMDKAEGYARKSLAVGESRYAQDDPRLEEAISGVIRTACINGACKDLTDLYGRLLSIRERRLGADAMQTCAARQMLAEGYLHKKKFDLAEALFVKNVQAYSKHFPNLVANGVSNLAVARDGLGKTKEAEVLLLSVVQMRRKSNDKSLTAQALTDLALHYQRHGELTKASAAFEESLPLIAESLGKDSEQYGDQLARYCDLLKEQGCTAEAVRLRRQSDSILDQVEASKRAPAVSSGSSNLTSTPAAK